MGKHDRVGRRHWIGRDIGAVMLADLPGSRQPVAQQFAEFIELLRRQRTRVVSTLAQFCKVSGGMSYGFHGFLVSVRMFATA